MKLTTILTGFVAMAASLPAATIYFGGGGSEGSSLGFGPVTATGYTNNGVLGTLFGKGSASTGSEDGLGLTNDPTGCPTNCDNEIFAGTNFIQLTITGLSGPISISFGSTSGDGWAVYGTNSAGTLAGATSLATGGNDDHIEVSLPTATSYTYLDIKATSNNILLQDLVYTSSVPEPGTLGIVGLGGVLIGLLRRKVRQS